ncbi:DNA primase small subunit-like [Anneissia japonica]|uniref:DNA primase small subunit-like n=1 Tax=Anneissia japonica TaxID=1529436 RepID=UPI0014259D13|nr:DNA primase small subunit-like [Anneissia japonica]
MPGEQNKVTQYSSDDLPELLSTYYKRLFPFGPYYRWLSYGCIPKTYFPHREFSFTLKDDIYVRYQSFSNQQEMEKEIQRCCPYKIDIGAVYTHRPKDHKTVKAAAFQAQEKELVFDIDMTDYDDVRNCCQGADICLKCWPLMTMAIKVVNRALRDDFGFEHILWVYSGRRGVHCWVADSSARKLSQNARTAIAEYLSVVKGGENKTKKVHLISDTLHPSLSEASKVIDKYFHNYAIENQGIVNGKDNLKKVLQLIQDETLKVKIAKEVLQMTDPTEIWNRIVEMVEDGLANSRDNKLKHCIQEIKMQYCYPRLDVNVSTGVNHLLKSPFCVHPKTGRVCVPMNVDKLDEFNPLTVPIISELNDEINQKFKEMQSAGEDATKQTKVKDYKITSMADSVEVFEKFVKGLEATWQRKKIEESDKTGEF